MHAHARHRSPGNGYRSTSSGMGGLATATAAAASSRISPEGSLRSSHAFHASSEYRFFNRTTSSSRPNSFQPPPPPQTPRKGDIFAEAGRLAAEYLVSQGLLPPTVLSSRWQNGSFKRILRSESENLQLGQEGRPSALARLGNPVPDAASGSTRRRFVGDEFPSSGFRNHPRGRRRAATGYRGYGADWGREYSRSVSFPDRFSDGEDDDTLSDQQQGSRDFGGEMVQKSVSDDLLSSKTATDSEPNELLDKPTSSETSQEPQKTSDEKVKDCASIYETDKEENVVKDLDFPKASEGESSSNTSDLLTSLTMCKFAKVPTRIRSSLTSKNPKLLDLTEANEVEQASATSSHNKMRVLVAEDSPPSDAMFHKTNDSKCLNSEIFKAQSAQDVGELRPVYSLENSKCETSLSSLPDRAFVTDNERELSRGPLELSSADKEKGRGEKRALEDSDMQEGAKRPIDWPPSVVMEAGGCFSLSNLSEKNITSHEDGASSGDRVIMDVDNEDSIVSNSQFSKDRNERHVDFSQEKQLFPSSFKICDLNLMEASETHENHDADPIIIYPALSEIKREAAPVDIDLSISNSNVSGENGKRPGDGKEIEVIDLENDSAQEDKDLVIEDRKQETVYTDLEGFPNHAQSTGDIPDVQDGYGLMISELLGNEFPNCSSVPEHINPMHNDIGLHNGEGALGDDDSIYMSLGEIPLTFLRPWDQPPPQEYEKPF